MIPWHYFVTLANRCLNYGNLNYWITDLFYFVDFPFIELVIAIMIAPWSEYHRMDLILRIQLKKTFMHMHYFYSPLWFYKVWVLHPFFLGQVFWLLHQDNVPSQPIAYFLLKYCSLFNFWKYFRYHFNMDH